MATQTKTITVKDRTELDSTVTSYISDGFTVARQTDTSVTMFKKKAFDLGRYFRGLLLCILPGIIYIFRYALEKNQMVIININPPQHVDDPAAGSSESA